jgi:hypothetical protein
MKTRFVRLLSASVVVLMTTSSAYAQATRTWVSGVGDDANPCSRTAPCKTFAGAISKTASGGEISVLDPGGYGTVTITKPITIDGAGTLASILASGTNGINVNITTGTAGTKIVTLRNLSINGTGAAAGLRGINFIAGDELHVENVQIERFTASPGIGISFTPATSAELFVKNSTMTHNTQGILVTTTVSGTARASIEDSAFVDNSGAGLRAEGRSTVSVRNSVATGNNNGFIAQGTTAPAFLQIDGCAATGNAANGIGSGFGGTFAANVSISNCLVSGNATGLFSDVTGNLRSWGNNKVVDNTVDGNPTSILTLK